MKHTKERFIERFDIKLTDEGYIKLCELCKDKNAIKIPTKSGCEKVIINFMGILVCCVTSKRRKIVKTVFPVKNKIFKKFILNSMVA